MKNNPEWKPPEVRLRWYEYLLICAFGAGFGVGFKELLDFLIRFIAKQG